MLGGFLKKIFFGKYDKQKNTGEKFGSTLQKKSQEIYEVANKKYNQGIEEFFSIKKKLKNLLETNYALGMKHLEKGNLSDAIFRFRFIKRFWPHHYQTYYQLAYCLFLDNNPQEAEEVLKKYNCKPTELPLIFVNDPAIVGLGVKPGDMLKITRPSSTSGESLYYRYVVEV